MLITNISHSRVNREKYTCMCTHNKYDTHTTRTQHMSVCICFTTKTMHCLHHKPLPHVHTTYTFKYKRPGGFRPKTKKPSLACIHIL